MSRLIEILNLYPARIVLGIIIGCLIGAPTVNGFTENKGWLIAAISFFILTLASMIWGFKFTKERKWLVWVIIAAVILIAAYTGIRWANISYL